MEAHAALLLRMAPEVRKVMGAAKYYTVELSGVPAMLAGSPEGHDEADETYWAGREEIHHIIWDALEAFPLASLNGSGAVGVVRGGWPTVDGSYNGDTTALVVVSVGPRPHVDVVGLWSQPEGDRDWQVPILDVEQAVRDACRRWVVKEVVCDPYRWGRSIQLLESEGLPMVVYPQSSARMTPATAKFYEAVTNAALTHSGDPRLARHVANCTLKVDARGQRLSKEHAHSTRRIDLAVAAVMAHDRAGQQPIAYDILQSVW